MIGIIIDNINSYIFDNAFSTVPGEKVFAGYALPARHTTGKTYPEACGATVSLELCEPNGIDKVTVDTGKAVVSYWHSGTLVMQTRTGAKQSVVKGTFSASLSIWCNGKLIEAGKECRAADVIGRAILRMLCRKEIDTEKGLIEIEQTSVRDAANAFGPFDSVQAAIEKGMFQLPHSYTTIYVTGTLTIQDCEDTGDEIVTTEQC